MSDIRQDFVKELVGTLRIYENMNVHGIYVDGSPVGRPGNWTYPPEYIDGHKAGMNMAIQTLLSITDSRELNNANWRITNAVGEVVPFYPADNPNGLPSKGDDGENVYVNGIISLYFDEVNGSA